MRVISLVPNGTEILFAVGAGDLVVGVSHECDYPAEARTRPILTGSALTPGMSAAEVDAAVSSQVGERPQPLYARRGADRRAGAGRHRHPAALPGLRGLDGAGGRRRPPPPPLPGAGLARSADDRQVFADIRRVGEVTGRTAEAEALLASLERRLEAVRAAVAEQPRPRVLALEWLDPPFAGGHWVPEMIELAGGEDVDRRPGDHSARLTWEQVAAADPDVIVVMPCGFDEAGAREQIATIADRPEWSSLRAVREGRVHPVDANGCFSRPGPRLVDGIERLAAILGSKNS